MENNNIHTKEFNAFKAMIINVYKNLDYLPKKIPNSKHWLIDYKNCNFEKSLTNLKKWQNDVLKIEKKDNIFSLNRYEAVSFCLKLFSCSNLIETFNEKGNFVFENNYLTNIKQDFTAPMHNKGEQTPADTPSTRPTIVFKEKGTNKCLWVSIGPECDSSGIAAITIRVLDQPPSDIPEHPIRAIQERKLNDREKAFDLLRTDNNKIVIYLESKINGKKQQDYWICWDRHKEDFWDIYSNKFISPDDVMGRLLLHAKFHNCPSFKTKTKEDIKSLLKE